jgi:hypothetical protein
MSPHSDIVSWFRINQSLLFLLNTTCSAVKQQILILKTLVWPDQGSNPRSTTLEASTIRARTHDLPHWRRARSGLEPTIYHTGGEHDQGSNPWSTTLETSTIRARTHDLPHWRRARSGLEPTIYHTGGEHDQGSNPRSTTLEASTFTITPSMWFIFMYMQMWYVKTRGGYTICGYGGRE